MKHSLLSKLGVAVAAVVLVGQGCITGNSVNPSDGSVWRTGNAGDTYTQLATLPESTGAASIQGVNVTSLEIDPSDSSAYYMGTTKQGLFTSLDGGNTWQRPEHAKLRSGWVVESEVDPNNVCTVYIALPTEILKSTDCLRSYTSVYTETRDETYITTFEMDWFNSNILWFGTTEGDVLKSSDAGVSWTSSLNLRDRIVTILVSNSDSRIVLVGTDDSGYHRTVDAGATWVEHEQDLRREYRNADEVYGFTQNRRGDVLLMNSEYGILRSTDAGATWESVNIIAPGNEAKIWSMAIGQEEDDSGVIYYATTGALYVSYNDGVSWEVKDLPSARAPKVIRVHPSGPSNLLIGFAVEET